MKLFKCHAVMPSEARSRLARTYLVIAENWQRARARVLELEPKAEFITVPVEAPDAHLVDVQLIDEREYAALRSACGWNETQLRNDEEDGSAADPHRRDH